MSGVIVEKLCLTGYRSFRAVLFVFSLFLDMMRMPTAYLNNLIGKTSPLSCKCKSPNGLQVFNDFGPGYLSSKFVKRYETYYSLWDAVNKVIVPFPRTNFMKNSFSYSGTVLWNDLPCDMREAKS